jgi:hypothetical protein
LIAAAGIALWLFAIKSIADSTVGPVEVWPWLIALIVIGACWWQIDRVRSVRLALRLERREALLLGAALIAVFAVLAFQIGQIPNSLWGDEGAFFTNARDVAHSTAVLDVFGLGTYAEPGFTTIFQSCSLVCLRKRIGWRLAGDRRAAGGDPVVFRVTRWARTPGSRAFCSLAACVDLCTMGQRRTLNFPVVLALALTWLAVRRDSRFYAFLAGGAAGLSFSTPATARIAIVLVPLWLIWMWITRRVGGANTIGRWPRWCWQL